VAHTHSSIIHIARLMLIASLQRSNVCSPDSANVTKNDAKMKRKPDVSKHKKIKKI
jgi:hypothetical protein